MVSQTSYQPLNRWYHRPATSLWIGGIADRIPARDKETSFVWTIWENVCRPLQRYILAVNLCIQYLHIQYQRLAAIVFTYCRQCLIRGSLCEAGSLCLDIPRDLLTASSHCVAGSLCLDIPRDLLTASSLCVAGSLYLDIPRDLMTASSPLRSWQPLLRHPQRLGDSLQPLRSWQPLLRHPQRLADSLQPSA
jgi:hypothetical protein